MLRGTLKAKRQYFRACPLPVLGALGRLEAQALAGAISPSKRGAGGPLTDETRGLFEALFSPSHGVWPRPRPRVLSPAPAPPEPLASPGSAPLPLALTDAAAAPVPLARRSPPDRLSRRAGQYTRGASERVYTAYAWLQELLRQRMDAGGLAVPGPLLATLWSSLDRGIAAFEHCR